MVRVRQSCHDPQKGACRLVALAGRLLGGRLGIISLLLGRVLGRLVRDAEDLARNGVDGYLVAAPGASRLEVEGVDDLACSSSISAATSRAFGNFAFAVAVAVSGVTFALARRPGFSSFMVTSWAGGIRDR